MNSNQYGGRETNSSKLSVAAKEPVVNLNYLIAHIASRNSDNKRIVSRVSTFQKNEIDDLLLKERRIIFDVSNNERIENTEDSLMSPDKIPVIFTEEIREKYLKENSLPLSNISQHKQIKHEMYIIKRKIEKENSEIKKLSEFIDKSQTKDNQLKSMQDSIRKKIDDLFSEY